MKEKSLGTRVREKRLEDGYGLRQLATILGISPSYLSRIERGIVEPSRWIAPKKTTRNILLDYVDEKEED